MTRARILAATFALLALCAPSPRAHEGPPFPILVDEPSPPWSVSVWADPDVGLGTFYVQLFPADGHAFPADTEVSVHVAPADGRLAETDWEAERERKYDPDDPEIFEQHLAEVEFPTREFWLVRVVVRSASADARAESVLRVEVTPPGYGPIDILLYMWPFAILAFFWLKAAARHRARLQAEAELEAAADEPAAPSTHPH